MLKAVAETLCEFRFYGGDVLLRPKIVLQTKSCVEVEFPTKDKRYIRKKLEENGFLHVSGGINEDGKAHYNYWYENNLIDVFVHDTRGFVRAFIYKP